MLERAKTDTSIIKSRARLIWKTGDSMKAKIVLPWEEFEVEVARGDDETQAILTIWSADQYADVELYDDCVIGTQTHFYTFIKIENIGDDPSPS